jgi:hypothetical protein
MAIVSGGFVFKTSNLTIADNTTVSDTIGYGNGVWSRIVDIQIVLNGLFHTFPDDLDFLLIGRNGVAFEFWSDAGGGSDLENANFHIGTIADAGAGFLPDTGGIAPGNYKPTDYNSGDLEDGAHWGLSPSITINHPQGSAPSGATFASTFGGVWESGIGNWNLYIRDDAGGDTGHLTEWGFTLEINTIVQPSDFDNDFASDILWQNSDGLPAMWLMDGGTTPEGGLGLTIESFGGVGPFGPFPFNPGPSWHIKDTGDFNGDGRSDILWQGNDGTPAIWLMNGMASTSTGAAGPFNPGPSWQIKGAADFNFDGMDDILWQGNDGTPAIWLMNGLSTLAIGAVGPFNPGPSWQIKGTGDFNGDGRFDILWQNSDGTPAIWLMNGMSFLTGAAAGPFNPGPSWQIKGTGDFNNDGMSDIVWQNSNGLAAIWLMNGFNVTGMGAVGPFNPGPSWHIQGTGDYNDDQKSDILWQADDGTPAIWLMNGLNFIFGGAAGSFNPGSDWHVIA